MRDTALRSGALPAHAFSRARGRATGEESSAAEADAEERAQLLLAQTRPLNAYSIVELWDSLNLGLFPTSSLKRRAYRSYLAGGVAEGEEVEGAKPARQAAQAQAWAGMMARPEEAYLSFEGIVCALCWTLQVCAAVVVHPSAA